MKGMVVLIDTNILLDFLEDREPFNEAANCLFKECDSKRITGHIAAHSIPDIFYILRKDYTAAERKEMLFGICNILDVVGIDKEKLINALANESFEDVEDCLQVECAKAVNADYIITRNINDFTGSPIPAILPDEFLKKMNLPAAEH